MVGQFHHYPVYSSLPLFGLRRFPTLVVEFHRMLVMMDMTWADARVIRATSDVVLNLSVAANDDDIEQIRSSTVTSHDAAKPRQAWMLVA